MTRKSKREVERALEDLDETTSTSATAPAIAWEDPDDGTWYDAPDGGERINPDEYDDGPLMVIVRDRVVETGWSR